MEHARYDLASTSTTTACAPRAGRFQHRTHAPEPLARGGLISLSKVTYGAFTRAYMVPALTPVQRSADCGALTGRCPRRRRRRGQRVLPPRHLAVILVPRGQRLRHRRRSWCMAPGCATLARKACVGCTGCLLEMMTACWVRVTERDHRHRRRDRAVWCSWWWWLAVREVGQRDLFPYT
jgi:hypothetical protein